MHALSRTGAPGCRRFTYAFAALAIACGSAAWAQVVTVPAAHLNHAEGSVAHAPQGDGEWHDVQPRRLLKRGDRLWVDRGSRAEVQAGGHALRLDSQTQVVLENVGETATQLSLTQGSLAATVTRMNPGDSFEVGTPNLAFRARQVGDYRVDVDTKQGVTRVVVLSGAGVVYGEKGEALEIRSGQRLSFKDRSLARVPQGAFAATDDFDRWAGARRRGEPTVSMPIVAAAAAAAPLGPLGPFKGKSIVISGEAGRGGATVATATPGPSNMVAPAARAAPIASALPAARILPASPAAAAAMRVNTPTGTAAAAAPTPSQQAQAVAQAKASAESQAKAAAQAQAQAAAQARLVAQAQAEAQARAAAQAQAAALATA
ncbi:MAG: putative Chromosome segregation ATPase, partial [Ramlibacter sp.]|nr:putative Chromosome segregation ATPase [Ramlibacter sp.]